MSDRVVPVGIGWRQPHFDPLLDTRPPLAFLEVHSENFFGDGGAALAVLEEGRSHYPVSLHGVGLGLGSAVGLDRAHLDRLASLVNRIEPMLVSDHASFARTAPQGTLASVHAADLLPVPFSREALTIMCCNVQQVQDRLQRPILVENISAYLTCPGDQMTEAEFLGELVRRTGCQILLDINNLYVNARNAALRGEASDACASVRRMVDALEPHWVGEIHLAGHVVVDDLGLPMVIDDHGSRVCDPVWGLYAHASRRLGVVPTLIEWDTNVPPLPVLLDEAGRARTVALAARAQDDGHVPEEALP